jgi:uncharacterized protein with HEPN domain
MHRNHKAYLADILDAIDRIEKMTSGMDHAEFSSDRIVQDAVVKNLLVIGEAVKSIPVRKQAGFEDVEWRKIAGLRDVLIHAYFNIDNRILWDIIQHKLGSLKNAATAMMAQADQ